MPDSAAYYKVITIKKKNFVLEINDDSKNNKGKNYNII